MAENTQEYNTLDTFLTDVADAIRNKTSTTAKITANDFPEAINNISTGLNTDDATATASYIAQDYTAYVKGQKITGSLARNTINDYNLSFDEASPGVASSDADLSIKVNVPMGYNDYIESGVIVSVPRLKDLTPYMDINESTGVLTLTLDAGEGYCLGENYSKDFQIQADNLKEFNILNGKNIFGVVGNIMQQAYKYRGYITTTTTYTNSTSVVTGNLSSLGLSSSIMDTVSLVILTSKLVDNALPTLIGFACLYKKGGEWIATQYRSSVPNFNCFENLKSGTFIVNSTGKFTWNIAQGASNFPVNYTGAVAHVLSY